MVDGDNILSGIRFVRETGCHLAWCKRIRFHWAKLIVGYDNMKRHISVCQIIDCRSEFGTQIELIISELLNSFCYTFRVSLKQIKVL